MDSSLDDDIKNKKIEINKIDPTPFTSKESNNNTNTETQKKPLNLVKNQYTKFINNIKNLATKNKKETSTNEVKISTSENEEQNQQPKSCKDKMANAIIAKVEVEKNITVFISLLGIGCFLICLSIFLLPLIITSPSKFSMCFALGSILILVSFLFYHGTKNYIMKLFDKKRFIITILFVCSIILGLIFSLGKHYFISLLCSLFQLISLILFVLTFVPGGKKGINCIKKKMSSPFVNIFMKIAQNEVNK
jgi:cation transport ATPase